jgi:hypothetical protein
MGDMLNMYEINCPENCGQIMLCTSPEWSVPKYLRADEFTCSKCKELIKLGYEESISGDMMRDEK